MRPTCCRIWISLVLATQNPPEQEGTYPLPEAQIDRFMMKVIVSYQNRIEERAILRCNGNHQASTAASRVPWVRAAQIVDAKVRTW